MSERWSLAYVHADGRGATLLAPTYTWDELLAELTAYRPRLLAGEVRQLIARPAS